MILLRQVADVPNGCLLKRSHWGARRSGPGLDTPKPSKKVKFWLLLDLKTSKNPGLLGCQKPLFSMGKKVPVVVHRTLQSFPKWFVCLSMEGLSLIQYYTSESRQA